MVPGLLYLDTARLGRMCAKARRALRDFAGLAGEVGLPLYCEEFLRSGFSALPLSLQRQLPSLDTWRGISQLKCALRQLVRGPADMPVFLANRSALLMEFAAGELFNRCQAVLTTDLDWPAYRSLIERRRSPGRRIYTTQIRNTILHNRASSREVIQKIVADYVEQECDGLYLTAVSHDGVRLPAEEIVRQVELRRGLEMVVVDAAQDFCHTTSGLPSDCCDLYVAGCHKWLRAYQPMGVMLAGRSCSRESLQSAVTEQINRGDIDDPLLRFAQQIEWHCLDRHTETVNVMPMFACAGAVGEALSCNEESGKQHQVQLANADCVAELARAARWNPLFPHGAFRSGIVILETTRESTARLTSHQLQSVFHEWGISLTAYENGRIRLSMPKWPLAGSDLDRLRRSFQRAA